MILEAIKNFFRTLFRIVLTIVLTIALVAALYYGERYGIVPEYAKKAKHFGIEVLTSTVDFNGNGTDDYTDLVKGARRDAILHPKYVDEYYEGGYPPFWKGVCTDLVWRAFKHAGYDLKAMVDADIAMECFVHGPGFSSPAICNSFSAVSLTRVSPPFIVLLCRYEVAEGVFYKVEYGEFVLADRQKRIAQRDCRRCYPAHAYKYYDRHKRKH